jgi:glycerol dehydrogenase
MDLDRQGGATPEGPGRGRARFESARRVFRIIDFVSRHEGVTAKAISRELGIGLSTCYYLINILLEEGYLTRYSRAAHSIHNGLTALEGTHHYWHGEKVAFGVISMLMLEERPTEILAEVVDFCLEVGLPVALEDIGLEDATREDPEKVAEAACIEGETIHNMPFQIHPPMLVDAMLAADAYGRQRRALLAGEAALPEVA